LINAWSSSAVASRYNNYFTCKALSSKFKTVPATLAAYQGQYAEYMDSVTTRFDEVSDSFAILSGEIETLAGQTADLAQDVEDYYVSINKTLTSITDTLGGLENVLNCSFMKKIKDDLEVGTCKNLMPSSFILTLCLGLASFFLIISSIVSLVLARKLSTWADPSVSN
jgi:hypothetical protein